MKYKEIIQRFEIKSSGSNKYMCKCPGHKDDKASLSIAYDMKEGKTLINCCAGCYTRDVLKAVGLTLSDLFDEPIIDKPINNRDGFKNYNEIIQYLMENTIDDDSVTKVYKFKDENNKIKYIKLRTENKKFLHVRLIDNCLVWGLRGGEYYETYDGSNIYSSNIRNTRVKEFKEQDKILYNLNYVIKGINEDKTIYIVEGEKDADNLISRGLIATTTSTGGGKGDDKWNDKYSEYFKGAKVVILSDNDESGQAFAVQVKKSILSYCYKVQVLTLSNKEKGDVSDWIEEGHVINEIYELLQDIKPTYASWYNVSKSGKVTLNKNRLAHHLSRQWNYVVANNGMGYGILHLYRNGVYVPICRLESYIRPYIYIDYRSPETVKSVFESLKQVEGIKFEDMHGDENIINLKNGLYNINTKQLKPHDKSYISNTQIDCSYEENPTNYGMWDNYINYLTDNNEESVTFLQEVAGVILSNVRGYRMKSIIGLQGKGDTGKSQFFIILGKILGDELVGTASLQKISNAQFIASAIYGKRIVFDGDLPSEPLSSVDMLKKLSGGDVLPIEFKGMNSFNYVFNGLIVFCCNEMPYLGNDKGDHYYNRLNILQCNNVVPKEKRDPFLADNILKKESSYIFSWALQGLERVIKNGYKFTELDVIKNLRDEVKNNQDSVRAFINSEFDLTDDNTHKLRLRDLYLRYENYCIDEGHTPCKKKSFRIKLISFYNLRITRPQNIETIHGIKNKM